MIPVSTDITYELGKDGQTHYKITTMTYEDGSIDVSKRPDGTSDQIAYEKANEIEEKINNLVENSQIISKVNARLKEIVDFSDETKTQIGISLLQVIQNRYKDILLTKGWKIDNGSGFVPLVFTINASNVLKYSINGAANKNAKCYGGIIELIDYPASNIDTDFFLSENEGLYFSLPNRTVKIKKP